MISEYLFVFGYESPSERESNRTAGTDQESMAMVRILAADEAQAMAWGEEIAERFFSLLHQDSGLSWKQAGFASWIESEPDEYIRQHWATLPLVRLGEYPMDLMAIAPSA
jgi:hypothetical protein